MSAIQNDFSWADRFLPTIKQIVGPYLLEAASLDIDRHRATDLVVLRAKNLSIACRVRRPSFGRDYSMQFTLRSRRGSGAKTEFDKIVEGFGDLILYGFSAPDEKSLTSWNLIDLHAFRAHLILHPQLIRSGERFNVDGTGFRWFDLTSFPNKPPILIASSTSLSKRAA